MVIEYSAETKRMEFNAEVVIWGITTKFLTIVEKNADGWGFMLAIQLTSDAISNLDMASGLTDNLGSLVGSGEDDIFLLACANRDFKIDEFGTTGTIIDLDFETGV